MVLKPDCASKDSFWGPAWPVPVVWHAAIRANTAAILAIPVTVISFFISLFRGKFQALIDLSDGVLSGTTVYRILGLYCRAFALVGSTCGRFHVVAAH